MPSTINASASSGLITTADTSGVLQLQTGGTTAVTVDASQNVTLAGTLTATGVTTVPAGTAAAPAITTTGDTNTGIFFPAADTIAFSEGGTEAMRLDSAGNMGLGVTPSAWTAAYRAFDFGGYGNLFSNSTDKEVALTYNAAVVSGTGWTYKNTNQASLYNQQNGKHIWQTAASGTAGTSISWTTPMTLDASGNLGVGTTSPLSPLDVVVGAGGARRVLVNYDDSIITIKGASNTANPETLRLVADNIRFNTGTSGSGSERARIDSSGNVRIGNTTGGTRRMQVESASANFTIGTLNTNAAPYSYYAEYSTSPNNTGSNFFQAVDSTTIRCDIRSNGGIANYTANDVNLSDRREKTNFAPAKSYLQTICAIPVQTFNYIDQNHEEDPGLTLGVVAQDVQEVAPELVMESNWGTQEKPKMRLSIYQTDLQYALMKSIQELKALVDTQASTITQLQADVAALKGA